MLVLSNNAQASIYVPKELDIAIEKKKTVEKLQNAYTITGYDAEDGVKIKASTRSKWDFRKFIKEFDVFQFVEWLMSE